MHNAFTLLQESPCFWDNSQVVYPQEIYGGGNLDEVVYPQCTVPLGLYPQGVFPQGIYPPPPFYCASRAEEHAI